MEPRPARLVLTTYEGEVTLVFSADIDVHEFLHKCEVMALAMQYAPESWEDAIVLRAETVSRP